MTSTIRIGASRPEEQLHQPPLMRTTLKALCVLALLAPACGQAAVEWIVDAQGCQVENRRPLPKQSVTWAGACRDGVAEGRGELSVFVDGMPMETYVGDVKAGRLAGQGVLTTRSGFRYEGGFTDGRYEGAGQVTWPGGGAGRGEFKAGRLEGDCTLTWSNGDRYEGQCKEFRPDGTGQTRFANGDAYTGAYSQGQAGGQGRYTWARGDTYEGRFAVGQAAGAGEYRLADGSRFVGNFRFGVPWGEGRVELPGGLGFEGFFELGAPGATGRFLKTDGPPPADSPELRTQLRLRYAKAQMLAAQQAAGTSAAMICRTMGRPDVPKTKLSGRAAYRAVAIVRDGRVTTVEVRTLAAAPDEALNQQLVANVERAVRAYGCAGDHVFEQEFAFRFED